MSMLHVRDVAREPGEEQAQIEATRAAIRGAVSDLFAPIIQNGLFDKLDRFLSRQGANLTIDPFAVGTVAVKLLERDPDRIRALIANVGPGILYVGGTNAVSAGGPGQVGSGFPIAVGATLELDAVVAGVWAIASQADTDVRVLDFSNGI